MGYFSWLTGDTKESISNSDSCRGAQTVYLLQPNGQDAIKESDYEGYGVFGHIDAYEWIAKQNLSSELLNKAEELDIELRNLGINMVMGKYFLDIRTNKKYVFMGSEMFDDLNTFVDDDGKQTNYGGTFTGETINDLIKNGIWIEKPLTDFLGKVKHPLKFSFNKDAVYEDIGESSSCPDQGFFY